MMEKPYAGNATITDLTHGIRIEIPSRKIGLVMIMLGLWSVALVGGFISMAGILLGIIDSQSADSDGSRIFVALPLVVWSIIGFFIVRAFVWMIAGKEVLMFEPGRLMIEKKLDPLSRPKTFDASEIKNIRVSEVNGWGPFGFQRNFLSTDAGGTIKFDYGLKTVRIADGVDETEAKHIIDLLIKKKLIVA